MQLVDFYFEEYRPKPLSFDLRFAAAVIGIVIAGLITLGIIQSSQLSDQQARLKEKQKQYRLLSEETQKLEKQLSATKDFKELDQEVARQTLRLNQYQKALFNLNLPEEGGADKFSEILKSLSDRKVDSLWLTQIDINQRNLSLYGSTTKSSSVPLYVEDLKNALSLNREFDDLSIQQNKENKRILDFALVNGRKIYE